MKFLKNLVFPGGFTLHGYCYLWTPGLIGLHVASGSLTALSHLAIAIIQFVHHSLRRQAFTGWTEKAA